FGMEFLGRIYFSIPDFPIQILSAFFLLNGAIAGVYILWRMCLEDFEGMVRLRNFIGINLLIVLILTGYLAVIF
ncbi:MAG: (4Fe-4S)-binding protein, partial [Desulfurivibrionaceae bacterium]|nr:(4Fe-4S)-binding protein [Desulfurivibrionaceae bacterium]